MTLGWPGPSYEDLVAPEIDGTNERGEVLNLVPRIECAEERIREYVRETPVEKSIPLSRLVGGEVFLKLENFQLTGSFKIRGAMNKLLALSAAERERGIVAASSGNHGAAVALGIRKLGCEGTVFVPQGASQAKVDAIRSYGASVRTEGEDSGLTEVAARRWATERGKVYISPYNDFEVVAGQGTLAIEMLRDLGDLDSVLLALGGGGLISGVASYLKAHLPSIEVVACSPANSAVMYESLQCGRILEMASQATLSDGTAGGVEPGAITFDLCRQLIDHHILVEESEIESALRMVLNYHHMLIEGAAAVPVAALLKEPERFRDRRVAVVLCGSNISMDQLTKVLNRSGLSDLTSRST